MVTGAGGAGPGSTGDCGPVLDDGGLIYGLVAVVASAAPVTLLQQFKLH